MDWIGLAAPVVAAAAVVVSELTRKGKRDDEKLEYAENALKAAQRLDDPVLIEGYRRELERVLVSGIRVTRRTRETALAILLGAILISLGAVLATWAANSPSGTLEDQIGTAVWIVVGSFGAAAGTSMMLHALLASDGLRRGTSRSDIERDLKTDATTSQIRHLTDNETLIRMAPNHLPQTNFDSAQNVLADTASDTRDDALSAAKGAPASGDDTTAAERARVRDRLESESTRELTVNQLTEKFIRATQGVGVLRRHINSLPDAHRAVLHDRVDEIYAPIKEGLQVFGAEWLRGTPVVFTRENLNVARLLTFPDHELYCCVGCDAVFNGLPGVSAHQSGRFTAESCKPISTPGAPGRGTAAKDKVGDTRADH